MSTPEMTPQEVQARMISLHHELSNFMFYLARIPHTPDVEDSEAIIHIQVLLERETRRMGEVIKRRNLDTMVENSLKAAGFAPDAPSNASNDAQAPADDSK